MTTRSQSSLARGPATQQWRVLGCILQGNAVDEPRHPCDSDRDHEARSRPPGWSSGNRATRCWCPRRSFHHRRHDGRSDEREGRALMQSHGADRHGSETPSPTSGVFGQHVDELGAAAHTMADDRCGVCAEPKHGVGDVRHLQCLTEDELAMCRTYWQTRQSRAAASGQHGDARTGSNPEDAWSRYMISVRLSAVLYERRSRRAARRKTTTRGGRRFGP